MLMATTNSQPADCNLCKHVVSSVVHYVPIGMSIEQFQTERDCLHKLMNPNFPEGCLHEEAFEIVGFDNYKCRLNQNIEHNGDCSHFSEGVGSGEDVYACRFGDRKLNGDDKEKNRKFKPLVNERLEKAIEKLLWERATGQKETE